MDIERHGHGRLLAVALSGVLLTLGACESTHQARSVEPSGFLGDYSMMRKGETGEALLVFLAEGADFSGYSKIVIDPIRVYANPDGNLGKLSKEDLAAQVNYLDAALRQELGTDFTLVNAAGPDVMRLRVAITEAEDSNVLLDTVSTILPIGLALSSIKRLAVGSHTAVGEAGIEAELQDSSTGKRLAAAVDRRIGKKFTGNFDKFNQWHAVQNAFDYWAERLKERLVELRAGSAG